MEEGKGGQEWGYNREVDEEEEAEEEADEDWGRWGYALRRH